MAGLTYPELLSEAWRQHLAPREPDAPTVISTFAGCGGSSLGYSMAGFRELLAVEWDQNACDHLRANFSELDVWQGDIAALSVEEVLERTGLTGGGTGRLRRVAAVSGFLDQRTEAHGR